MSVEGTKIGERPAVTAEVGITSEETTEVPEQVGEYHHRDVPNDDTTTWERVHQPREAGEYPYVAVRYGVSCAELAKEEDHEFHVTRSVVVCSRRGGVPNHPHANDSSPTHAETVVSVKDIVHGVSEFADALAVVVQLMDTDSTDPGLPPELTDSQRAGYRKLETGEVDNQ